MFELPRTTLAVAICLVAALILTGFRLWLYWERRADVNELTGQQKLKLFWIGFRLDAVIVSRGCLPLVVAALTLPGDFLVSSQFFFGLYLSVLYFTIFFAEIAGIFFFRFYDFRPNYLVFEHGADREVLKTVAKAYPLVRIFYAKRGRHLAGRDCVAVSRSTGTGQPSRRAILACRITAIDISLAAIRRFRQPRHLRSPAAQSESGVVYDQSDRQRDCFLRDFQSALRVESAVKK